MSVPNPHFLTIGSATLVFLSIKKTCHLYIRQEQSFDLINSVLQMVNLRLRFVYIKVNGYFSSLFEINVSPVQIKPGKSHVVPCLCTLEPSVQRVHLTLPKQFISFLVHKMYVLGHVVTSTIDHVWIKYSESPVVPCHCPLEPFNPLPLPA